MRFIFLKSVFSIYHHSVAFSDIPLLCYFITRLSCFPIQESYLGNHKLELMCVFKRPDPQPHMDDKHLCIRSATLHTYSTKCGVMMSKGEKERCLQHLLLVERSWVNHMLGQVRLYGRM